MNIELLIAGIVVLIIVVGLVGWLVGVYNGLVMRRNDVDKAFANIDVLLKQRADQIPDLMRVVQTAMNHERALFTRLSDARQQYLNASSLNDKVEASNQLNAALKSVIAVAEGYPTLISGPNAVELQQAASAVEERIADRRADAQLPAHSTAGYQPDTLAGNDSCALRPTAFAGPGHLSTDGITRPLDDFGLGDWWGC